MHAARRALVAIPVVAMLAWAALTAFDIARAKQHTLEAATEMATWAGRPDPSTFESVRGRLNEAARIHGHDPTQRELLGILMSGRLDDAQRGTEAVGHFVSALSIRPTSPHAWAFLVETRYRAGEPGRNLEMALQRAVALGPAEPGVQHLVADYGLAVWNEVTPVTQAAIDRMIASGIRRNPLEILRISERRGRLEAACRHLTGTSIKPGARSGMLCPWEITP